jgi:hypothetical protein
MSDNKINKPDKIVFTVETSIKYWCKMLNCEREDLLYAIRAIGNSYEAVDSFLILNRKKKS